MPRTTPEFRAPSPVERLFNRIFGFLVGLGLGFRYNVASASWSPLAAEHNGCVTPKPPEKSR